MRIFLFFLVSFYCSVNVIVASTLIRSMLVDKEPLWKIILYAGVTLIAGLPIAIIGFIEKIKENEN